MRSLIIAGLALALASCGNPNVEPKAQDGGNLPDGPAPVAAEPARAAHAELIIEVNGCQIHQITDANNQFVGYMASRPDSGACSLAR